MMHPYKNFPDSAYWSRSIARLEMEVVDPVLHFPFKISKEDKIVSAGSCFAQHISKVLDKGGFHFFITEKAHPLIPEDLVKKNNYGIFSARYGNIYTARQLVQLFQRVYGLFSPQEDVWEREDGTLIDPFRPNIQPDGFSSRQEYELDRKQHYRYVRQAFEELDVFVFTLGLTECWLSRCDGAAYPICPGVVAGEFTPEKYRFVNFTVDEIVRDMIEFIDYLRDVNPKAKVILTVSPVPLVATAEAKHVLVSTTYSKSVLRVASEMIASRRKEVAYFPAYEIITGNYNRGQYFAADLRTVNEDGVNHVMRLFMKHATLEPSEASVQPAGGMALKREEPENEKRDSAARVCLQNVVETMCDEEFLDYSARSSAAQEVAESVAADCRLLKTMADLEGIYSFGVEAEQMHWKIAGYATAEGVFVKLRSLQDAPASEITSGSFAQLLPGQSYQQSVELLLPGVSDEYVPDFCFTWYTKEYGHRLVDTKWERLSREKWRGTSCYTPQKEIEQVRLLDIALCRGAQGMQVLRVESYSLS